jgi:hypothetical protein
MRFPEQLEPVHRERYVSGRAVRGRAGGATPQSIACVTGTCTAQQCCVDVPVIGKRCIPNPLGMGGATAKACLERLLPRPRACFYVNNQKVACLG